MTYTELLDAEWEDIENIMTDDDVNKLREIDGFCRQLRTSYKIVLDWKGSIVRQQVRNWCLSKDREQKLNDLL